MKKHTLRFPLLLVIMTFIFLTTACKAPDPKTAGLQLNERASDGSISGSYQYDKTMGSRSVQFSVSQNGLASFRLKDAPEAETLIINYNPSTPPMMNWQGENLDGLGALTSKEQKTLDNLLNSELSHGLAMIPLDIACQPENNIDPVQLAALLYPLQMRFKYQVTDRAAVSSTLGQISACQYAESDEAPNPLPPLIMMSPSSPVPVVFGYFPFDAEGAVEKPIGSSSGMKLAALDRGWWGTVPYQKIFPDLHPFGPDPIKDEWGPCEAKCRGACGPDCTHNNCKFYIDDRCEKNQEGNNDGFRSFHFVYECGLHPACIEHDACYDDCNRRHGCDTFAAAVCMHAGIFDPTAPWSAILGLNISCDRTTLNEEETSDVMSWVRGYGPFTAYQVFEYSDPENRYEYDPVHCPLSEEAQNNTDTDQSAAEPENELTVVTYKGTGDWFSEKRKAATQSITSEIIISIDENGNVTGSLTEHDIEITYHNTQDDCSGHWEHVINGTFSGQLEGNSGVINLTENITATNYSNCPDINPGYAGTFEQVVEIELVGDTLTGRTQPSEDDPDDVWMFTFTAKKQEN